MAGTTSIQDFASLPASAPDMAGAAPDQDAASPSTSASSDQGTPSPPPAPKPEPKWGIERLAANYDISKPPANGFEKNVWPMIQRWHERNGGDSSRVNMGKPERPTADSSSSKAQHAQPKPKTPPPPRRPKPLNPRIIPVRFFVHHCVYHPDPQQRKSINQKGGITCFLTPPRTPWERIHVTSLAQVRKCVHDAFENWFAASAQPSSRSNSELVIDLYFSFRPGGVEERLTEENWYSALIRLDYETPRMMPGGYRRMMGTLVGKVSRKVL